MSDADIVEIAEQKGFLFAAITDTWGPRCPDVEPGCWCCKAWAEYDALTARVEELEGALKQIAEMQGVCAADVARAAITKGESHD